MLQLDPEDPDQLSHALHRAVRDSKLTLDEICQRLEQEYGVSVTASAISHGIWRGGIRFQRALQILAVCGVSEVEIRPPRK
jgi:transposase